MTKNMMPKVMLRQLRPTFSFSGVGQWYGCKIKMVNVARLDTCKVNIWFNERNICTGVKCKISRGNLKI